MPTKKTLPGVLHAWLTLTFLMLFGQVANSFSGEVQDDAGRYLVSLPAGALSQPARLPLRGQQPSKSVQASVIVTWPDGLQRVIPASVIDGPTATGELAEKSLVAVELDTQPISSTCADELVKLSVQFLEKTNGAAADTSAFRFEETSPATITLFEGNSPVLAYNFGSITSDRVPENDPRRTRACYVHPVWGLDGEVITDDFPRDHYHHHGIFWTWPHVVIGEREFSLWEDRGGLRQRFVRWLCRDVSKTAAVLGVENAWVLDEQSMLVERVWLTVYPRRDHERTIDIDLFLQPCVPVTLWGAEGKSYGGLTMRFRPPSEKEARITVPNGLTSDDLYETRLPWADFTSRFGEGEALSGATVMIAPNHPDYPPTWLTRHYGPLCVGWPGTQSRTLQPGETIHLPYRLWIHRGLRDAAEIAAVYRAYSAVVDSLLKAGEVP